MINTPPIVLSIAGSDCSAGAGIQADLKAISALGGYAMTVITAVTAQNTQGVTAVQSVKADVIAAQLRAIVDDFVVDAVKVGMVDSIEVAQCIADFYRASGIKHLIVDPVMQATSGATLALSNCYDELLPLATLITPNLHEATCLLDEPVTSTQSMEQAARVLSSRYQTNLLLKGGHAEAGCADDVLCCYQDKSLHWFRAERVITRNSHGTGCSLSSAIALYLAKGFELAEAIAQAKHYLTAALKAGSQWAMGAGSGPVNHFFNLRS